MTDILDLVSRWPGEAVVVRHDAATGTWIFIAIHDSTLGTPSGGSRMRTYPSQIAALEDAMRLAEGMTYKWAGMGIDRGGAKAVLAVPHELEGAALQGLLHRYGDLTDTLHQVFNTGPDLGMGPERMEVVASHSRAVIGIDPRTGTSADPGVFTARGVLAGIRAALGHVFGTPDPSGKTVLVQGLGDVGAPLARLLSAEGAELLLSDLDAALAGRLAAELGATVVSPDAALVTPCDVLAPCAVGGLLTAGSIPTLTCRIVAGSANNQLAEPADADRLAARGIVYAPDYIINGGGAMVFALMHGGTDDEDELGRHVDGIGDAIGAILAKAAEDGVSPLTAAQRRVDRTLAEHRSAREAWISRRQPPLPSP